jgi:hypothetical protein
MEGVRAFGMTLAPLAAGADCDAIGRDDRGVLVIDVTMCCGSFAATISPKGAP